MTDEKSGGALETDPDKISAVVKVLPLAPGIFMFSVAADSAPPTTGVGGLKLPAIHVALGPNVKEGQIELLAGEETHGNWLHSQGDILIAKVRSPGATLVLTSVRNEAVAPLSIKIERMDAGLPSSITNDAEADAPKAQLNPIQKPVQEGLRVRVNAHVRARGDLSFVDTAWAGRVGAGLWIEAFSVIPLEQLTATDIEYKGLTSSGFETLWLSDGASCGTRGMSVPLIGFAIRPKTGSAAAGVYDCEYSGYFQSGAVIGPLRNGTPCRSTQANDPLEGIMVKILARKILATKPAEPSEKSVVQPVVIAIARGVGPSFSKFREQAATPVAKPLAKKVSKSIKAAPTPKAPAKRKK